MADKERIVRYLEEHRELFQRACEVCLPAIEQAAECLVEVYRGQGKLLVFGNGGSFADALHIEGEIANRLAIDRPGLPAIALGSGGALLTATANDYDYGLIFARGVEAHGRPGDAALGISTSGRSPNVVGGLEKARELGLHTIALTGEAGGPVADVAEIAVRVPSSHTSHIQEVHIVVAHILCDQIERAIFGEASPGH